MILFRLCNSQHIGITIHWLRWCHTFLNPQLLISQGPSWSYGSWIYNHIYNQDLSPLTLWVRTPPRRGVLDTTLCDKVCPWLAAGWWFSPESPVSSINKTDRHDITEILLKVALNTINQTKPAKPNLHISFYRTWSCAPAVLFFITLMYNTPCKTRIYVYHFN